MSTNVMRKIGGQWPLATIFVRISMATRANQVNDHRAYIFLLPSSIQFKLKVNWNIYVRLWYYNLNEQQLRGLENIKSNIETILLSDCYIYGDHIGNFWRRVQNWNIYIWIMYISRQRWPKLVFTNAHTICLNIWITVLKDMVSLLPFLERNPNTKCLQIVADDLYKIQ